MLYLEQPHKRGIMKEWVIIKKKKGGCKNYFFCASGMFVFISCPTFVGRSRSEGEETKNRKTDRQKYIDRG
jgi:hypothetical protein